MTADIDRIIAEKLPLYGVHYSKVMEKWLDEDGMPFAPSVNSDQCVDAMEAMRERKYNLYVKVYREGYGIDFPYYCSIVYKHEQSTVDHGSYGGPSFTLAVSKAIAAALEAEG